MELDFEIDKITESIENAQTGEVYKTLVLPVTQADLKEVSKKNGWLFDWKMEFSQHERQLFKLVTEKEQQIIHGLLSLEIMEDHVFMHLIESAPYNIGNEKHYLGVCGNLTAYGCKLSMDCGFGGVIAFISKTALIEHYEKTLGAIHLGGNRMGIYEEDAQKLIDSYF